jgi:hypothetical protein
LFPPANFVERKKNTQQENKNDQFIEAQTTP